MIQAATLALILSGGWHSSESAVEKAGCHGLVVVNSCCTAASTVDCVSCPITCCPFVFDYDPPYVDIKANQPAGWQDPPMTVGYWVWCTYHKVTCWFGTFGWECLSLTATDEVGCYYCTNSDPYDC